MAQNTFGAAAKLRVGTAGFDYFRLSRLEEQGLGNVSRLPVSTRILLENLLRNEDGVAVRPQDVEALATWDPKARPSTEIAFMPARVHVLATDAERWLGELTEASELVIGAAEPLDAPSLTLLMRAQPIVQSPV